MKIYPMNFDSKKFVREDQDERFSKDPKDPLFEEHYFDFVEEHSGLFIGSTFEQDGLDITFACECGCDGQNRDDWEVYAFRAWYHLPDETLIVNPIFFDHFFHRKEEKLRKTIFEHAELPETCYLLECKKCGSWYIWKVG